MASGRRFLVRSPGDGSAAFVVVDAERRAVPEVLEFCRWLVAMDRSAYTQRAYALGLAHFFDWLAQTGRLLATVERPVIAEYIADFRAGGKAGATRVDESRIGSVSTGQAARPDSDDVPSPVRARVHPGAFVFDYDAVTVAELDVLSDPPAGV